MAGKMPHLTAAEFDRALKRRDARVSVAPRSPRDWTVSRGRFACQYDPDPVNVLRDMGIDTLDEAVRGTLDWLDEIEAKTTRKGG